MQQFDHDHNHRQPYDYNLRLQYNDHHNRATWLWRRMYMDHAR